MMQTILIANPVNSDIYSIKCGHPVALFMVICVSNNLNSNNKVRENTNVVFGRD